MFHIFSSGTHTHTHQHTKLRLQVRYLNKNIPHSFFDTSLRIFSVSKPIWHSWLSAKSNTKVGSGGLFFPFKNSPYTMRAVPSQCPKSWHSNETLGQWIRCLYQFSLQLHQHSYDISIHIHARSARTQAGCTPAIKCTPDNHQFPSIVLGCVRN